MTNSTHLLPDLIPSAEAAMQWTLQTRAIACAIVVVLALIADFITKRILLTLIKRTAGKTATQVDDILLESGLFARLAHIAPALVIYLGAPAVLAGTGQLPDVIRTATMIAIMAIVTATISAALNALARIIPSLPRYRHLPIRGITQIVQLLLYLTLTILVLSQLVGKSPAMLLSGLGALSAVMMLIFRDALTGLVAGIQLSANNMLQEGDWLEMPAFGADGDVIEISLTTVKVQNWDKTISTIPTYALITNSFKNWRGMSESGGRRIKRAIHIDMTSVRFSSPEMIEKYRRMQLLRPYIEKKLQEIKAYNAEHQIDESESVNGRRITNLGTFRAYLVAYLRNHPMINQEMTFLVRHLAPTDHGIPIEVYVFSSDKVWANYEAIQADIFDHILAIIPEFGLRVFQQPTGADLQQLRTPLA
jgi:miniconductance mechanosensitive channel